MTLWPLTILAQTGPSIALTDQGFIAFCALLLIIFAAEFAMILREGNARSGDREDFVEFRAEMRSEFRLMQVKSDTRARVGVVNALDVLSDPNPWEPEELAIRDRMHRNPDFYGIEDWEIETIIRRLDAEIREGNLVGDKLMAAHFMLRELNGELARRFAERQIEPVPVKRRRLWGR